jgi:hypothetical protein
MTDPCAGIELAPDQLLPSQGFSAAVATVTVRMEIETFTNQFPDDHQGENQ